MSCDFQKEVSNLDNQELCQIVKRYLETLQSSDAEVLSTAVKNIFQDTCELIKSHQKEATFFSNHSLWYTEINLEKYILENFENKKNWIRKCIAEKGTYEIVDNSVKNRRKEHKQAILQWFVSKGAAKNRIRFNDVYSKVTGNWLLQIQFLP